MKQILGAEHLKHKRSVVRKLVWIAPATTLLMAWILMPAYFQVNAYNWWYIIIFPAMLSLVPAQIHRRDEAIGYRGAYALSTDLKKQWIAKVFIALAYLAGAPLIHMMGVWHLQSLGREMMNPVYPWQRLAWASGILVLVNAWQVPLVLYLCRRLGTLFAIAVHGGVGVVAGALCAQTDGWFAVPYSWGAHRMVSILGILPNGIPVEASAPALSDVAVSVFAAVFFLGLLEGTARAFERGEVSK